MPPTNNLAQLVQAFSHDRPPVSEKLPPKPPTNRQVIEALYERIETLLSERYPHSSIVQMLERHDVKVSVSTLKTYLRHCRKAEAFDVEQKTLPLQAADVPTNFETHR